MEKCPREETFLHLLMGFCLILPLSGLTRLLILSLYHIITKLCPGLLGVCSFAVLALVIPAVCSSLQCPLMSINNSGAGEMLIAAIISD